MFAQPASPISLWKCSSQTKKKVSSRLFNVGTHIQPLSSQWAYMGHMCHPCLVGTQHESADEAGDSHCSMSAAMKWFKSVLYDILPGPSLRSAQAKRWLRQRENASAGPEVHCLHPVCIHFMKMHVDGRICVAQKVLSSTPFLSLASRRICPRCTKGQWHIWPGAHYSISRAHAHRCTTHAHP